MLLQIKNCMKQFFCLYLWVGDQVVADNQLIYHNTREDIFIKRVCEFHR